MDHKLSSWNPRVVGRILRQEQGLLRGVVNEGVLSSRHFFGVKGLPCPAVRPWEIREPHR